MSSLYREKLGISFALIINIQGLIKAIDKAPY